jgi:hypothetical protein
MNANSRRLTRWVVHALPIGFGLDLIERRMHDFHGGVEADLGRMVAR